MSIRRTTARLAAVFALFLAICLAVPTEGECQFSGRKPDKLSSSDELSVIKSLDQIFPEKLGFRVNAPLEPIGGTPEDLSRLLRAFRVIVPADVTVPEAARRLTLGSSPFERYVEVEQDTGFLPELPVGYSGSPVTARLGRKLVDIHFLTVNMDRWLIWARSCYFPLWKSERDMPLQKYAAAVSQYLRRTDFGNLNAPELQASAHGVTAKADLFGESRPQRHAAGNYAAVVQSHREIESDVAKGVISFAMGQGAVDWLVDHRGDATFRDRSQAHLQRTFYEFMSEGRSLQELRTLTPEILATLEPGRYFYAVDEYGRLRFGPMQSSQYGDPDGIWRERLKSYECLLFPGQPVLAAGEFDVVRGDQVLEASLDATSVPTPRLASLNTFSGYYYYHCDDKNLETQIKEKSDKYLLTVGHLLKALRDIGIPLDGVEVSKF